MDLVLRLARTAAPVTVSDLPKVWRQDIDRLLARLLT